MDHVRLYPMRLEPASQPEAVTAGFEGQCNPRDLAAGLDRLVAPAMQQAKQPFWTRLQLLARLTLNAGKHTGNQPTRLAHLDDGNDRAILIQGDEGPAQVVRLGHRGTPSVHAATMVPSPRRLPHSISWSHPERQRSEGATWVPPLLPVSESRPPEKRQRSAELSATASAVATPFHVGVPNAHTPIALSSIVRIASIVTGSFRLSSMRRMRMGLHDGNWT